MRHVNELEVTWKEMAMALSKYYPSIYLKGLRKTTKTGVSTGGAVPEI
jgi:hypothetical protein